MYGDEFQERFALSGLFILFEKNKRWLIIFVLWNLFQMKEKDKKIVDLQQHINELKQNLYESQSQLKEIEENFNYKITNIQKVSHLSLFLLASVKSFYSLF